MCTYGGREYRLEINTDEGHHIHGLAINRSWRVQHCRATEEGAAVTLTFTAAEHADVMAQFPHPFVLTLTYTLREGALHCEATVRTDGPDPMPFGLGFHPYFATPAVTPGRYRFRLLEPGAPVDLRTWTDVHATPLDHGFALDRTDGGSRFELHDTLSGRRLTLAAGSEYRHWVVFSGRPAEGFVCLEPYTCMTNAFNLPDAVADTWVIAPGETRSAGSWSLSWTLPH